MKKIVLPITIALLLTLFLLSSCNTENEGIFHRISESVPKVDVGSIDLILKDGNALWAYTSATGLRSYDISTKKWSERVGSKVINYTAANSTTIVYSTQTTGSDNSLYTLDTTTTEIPTKWNEFHYVVDSAPQSNLLLIKDNSKFKVYKTNSNTLSLSEEAEYSDYDKGHAPRLIASGDDFIVTGVSGTDMSYTHYYKNETTELKSSGDSSFTKSPIIAFGTDGTNSIVIIGSGRVYYSDDKTNFSYKETIPLLTSVTEKYPSFVYDGSLYIQNRNNTFYKVDIADETVSMVNADWAKSFTNIAIKSYLVDNNEVYVGTQINGLYRIDMSSNSVTKL